VGFAIGLALLIWCIRTAVSQGDWQVVGQADPLLVAGLVGCTVVSQFANGALFWLVIRPVQPLRLWDMQFLNLTTGVLNYAPIRAGLIARIAYHIRVDRMPLLRIGAWFLALGYTMALTIGACVAATIVRPQFDLIWAGVLVGLLILGGLLTLAFMSQPLIKQVGRGMDQMLGRPACLWGAIAWRLLDVAAFAGRMACAVAILGLELPPADVLLLAFATLVLSLNPLGRIGFREAGVAIVAQMLVASDLTPDQIAGEMATLALVDSAGEALVIIPFGLMCLLWYRRRWMGAGRVRSAGTDPMPPDGARTAPTDAQRARGG
jgi:hypothetical protein